MKTRKSRMTRNKIDKSKIISDSKEYSEANTIRAVKGSEDESSNGLSTKKIEYPEEIISKNMDLFDKKEIEIFSLITLDKKKEKNKTESEIEKRKIENKNYLPYKNLNIIKILSKNITRTITIITFLKQLFFCKFSAFIKCCLPLAVLSLAVSIL